MDALQNAQNFYLSLLKLGWTPQQARDVLPLSVKSELISCGFKDAWENFFYRRCSKVEDVLEAFKHKIYTKDFKSSLKRLFKELGYDNQ